VSDKSHDPNPGITAGIKVTVTYTHPSSNVDLSNVDDIFSYHPPSGDQPSRYERIRAAAKEFAIAILRDVPACADRSVAIRHVRDAVMIANAAIALEPKEE